MAEAPKEDKKEERLPFPTYIQLPKLKKNFNEELQHAFFTRYGGVSQGLLSECNVSWKEKPKEIVVTNRERCAVVMNRLVSGDEKLKTPLPMVCVAERHTNQAIIIDDKYLEGMKEEKYEETKCDGMATALHGVVLGIYTADCGPVFFYDPKNHILGACHSGWTGALNGILEDTVKKMESLGGDRKEMFAVLGPCLHQKSYEVGPEFPPKFTEKWDGNKQFFIPGEGDRLLFDLPGYVACKIERMCGISKERIEVSDVNTFEDDRFYSYRLSRKKAEGTFGNFMSAVVIMKKE